MEKISVKISEDKIIIGQAPKPQLVIDLEKQENCIITEDRTIPYRRKVLLSPDLLCGKRQDVLLSALGYYYSQACGIARDMKLVEEYRGRMNITERVKDV